MNLSVKLSLLAILIFAIGTINVFAGEKDPKKWQQEYRKQKQEFLIKELQLNDKQQKEFLPLYFEMDDAINKSNYEEMKIRKETINKKNVSDAEYQKVVDTLLKSDKDEMQMRIEYFPKFGKILSKKQLFMLLCAEKKFAREMMRKRGNNKNVRHDGQK